MENNQKRQANNHNYERERFSNFVVDLRQKGSQSLSNLKKELQVDIVKDEAAVKKELRHFQAKGRKLSQKIKKAERESLEKVKTVAELILPDLLAPPKKPLVIFSWLAGLKKNIIKKPKQNFWIKELRQREDEFRRHVSLRAARLQTRAKKNRREAKLEEPVRWYRSVLYFSLILIIIILPFKVLSALNIFDVRSMEARIMSHSELAINSLMAAAESVTNMDLKHADADFQTAGANFLEAQNELSQINDAILILASFSGDEKIKLAAESKKFLSAGAYASSLGSNLVLATDSLFGGEKNKNFAASLDNFLAYGQAAVSDSKSLKKIIAKINPDNLPEAYRAKFISLSKQADFLADNLENFVAAGMKLKELTGLSHDKRYLLVFQNNAELRASGGFIGSYALVDVRDGKIRNLEVPGGGSYDTEGGMKANFAAPEPMWLVNPLWHFWDANWWPDWPTTAQNLAWFYEKSGGPSVDGVISVTPTVVERLLEVTGPIDLTAEYGLVIDKDNFWETVQKVTEQKNLAKTNPEAVLHVPTSSALIKSALPLQQGLQVNADNKPKKIIGDLFAKILEILPQKLNQANLVKIITIFEENMSEKQILFYFNDPVLQSEFSSRNWAGEVRATTGDYLMVVNTNIAGQKSDRLMSEQLDLQSAVQADGSIVNTLSITRTHHGVKNEILTGVRNVDWLRVYVPAGSELLDASGYVLPEAKYLKERPQADWETIPALQAERSALTDSTTGVKIYREKDKTVFANWLMVDPGQTATVVIKYRLPFNVLQAKDAPDSWRNRLNNYLNTDAPKLLLYSLLVQKQPGAKPSDFSSNLSLPDNLSVFWQSADDNSAQNGWQITAPLDADKFYSLLVQKKK